MAPSSSSCHDAAASMLLCAEDNSSILWLEDEEGEVGERRSGGCRSMVGDLAGGGGGGSGGGGVEEEEDMFPPQSEECVASLVEREQAHMPRADYGERLRGGGGDVDLRVRSEAIGWIWEVHSLIDLAQDAPLPERKKKKGMIFALFSLVFLSKCNRSAMISSVHLGGKNVSFLLRFWMDSKPFLQLVFSASFH